MSRRPTADRDSLFVKELRDRLGDDLRAVIKGRGDYDLLYHEDDEESRPAPRGNPLRSVFRGPSTGEGRDGRDGAVWFLFKSPDGLTFYFARGGSEEWFITLAGGADVDVELIEATCRKHL